jgi:hypothetical protein
MTLVGAGWVAPTELVAGSTAGVVTSAGGAVGSFRTEEGTSRPRSQSRDQLQDVLTAPAGRLGQYGLVVLGREMRSQQPYRGERQRAGSQPVEDHRESATGPSGVDAIACRVFGETQDPRAIAEERAMALCGMKRRPGIERGQVGDQLRGRLALLAGERREAVEKVVIGETGRENEHVRVHSAGVSRCFLEAGRRTRRRHDDTFTHRAVPRSVLRAGCAQGANGARANGALEMRT